MNDAIITIGQEELKLLCLGLTWHIIWPDDTTSGSNHSVTLKNMYNYREKQKIFPVLANMSSLACLFYNTTSLVNESCVLEATVEKVGEV